MSTSQRRGLALAAWLALLAGCGESPQSQPAAQPGAPKAAPAAYHLDLPKADAKPGTAVVILVDTSGSMDQPVPDAQGKPRPKYLIARDALNGIVAYTADWKKSHPKSPLQLAIFNFSSRVNPVLPMGDFDADKAKTAIGKIPAPNGGTAIGLAIEEGYKALYKSGCARKFIVCVTDGENTSGPGPDVIAPRLHEQTQGAVQLNFVAFDTRASQFKFLAPIGGHVVEAADGGKLQAELTNIYEKRILAEAPEQ
jgi:hypothetical protein